MPEHLPDSTPRNRGGGRLNFALPAKENGNRCLIVLLPQIQLFDGRYGALIDDNYTINPKEPAETELPTPIGLSVIARVPKDVDQFP